MREKNTKSSRILWAAALLLFFGGIYSVGIFLTYRSAMLVIRGETATALCTSISKKTSGSGSNVRSNTTWHVTYPTADGSQQSGVIDASFRGLDVGGEIEVIYDPKEPSRVQANNLLSLWGLPLLFGITIPISFGRASRKRIRQLVGSDHETDD